MPLYRVQVELPNKNGNPRDVYLNTWHFLATNPTVLNTGPIVQLSTYYGSFDGIISSLVALDAAVFRAYDLADPEPRAPVLEEVINLGDEATTTTAPELCIVLSYEAPQQSGATQKRRRGRIYNGPFSSGLLNTTTGQIATVCYEYIRDAAQDLLDASQAATDWSWQIYSPTNESSVEVMHAWVDNAVDIQRRRGLEATVVLDVV